MDEPEPRCHVASISIALMRNRQVFPRCSSLGEKGVRFVSTYIGLWYHSQVSLDPPPPDLVDAKEQQELDRFPQMGVYWYVLREEAEREMQETCF